MERGGLRAELYLLADGHLHRDEEKRPRIILRHRCDREPRPAANFGRILLLSSPMLETLASEEAKVEAAE